MTTTTKPKAHLNVVAIALRLLIQLIGWIALSWLIAQLVLLITSAWHGHQVTLISNEQLLNHESHVFLLQPGLLSQLPAIMQFDKSIADTLQQLAQAIPPLSAWTIHNQALQNVLHVFYPPLADYARSALVITQVVLLRITEVFLFIPLIVLLGLLGFSNGLVQRSLRRINGGRESSLQYHYAKAAIKPFLFYGSLLYVALPFPFEPTIFLLPCVIASSLAVFFAVKTFKKYS